MRKAKLENRNPKLGLGSLTVEAAGLLQRIFNFPFSIFEFRNTAGGWISALGALAITLMDPAVAAAQSCAMCYTAAAAANAATIKALRSGILILLFPPVLIFIAIFVVAYRRRNTFNEPVAVAEADEHESGLCSSGSNWLKPPPSAAADSPHRSRGPQPGIELRR